MAIMSLPVDELNTEKRRMRKCLDSYKQKQSVCGHLANIGTGLAVVGLVATISGNILLGLYLVAVSVGGLPLAVLQQRSASKQWQQCLKHQKRIDLLKQRDNSENLSQWPNP